MSGPAARVVSLAGVVLLACAEAAAPEAGLELVRESLTTPGPLRVMRPLAGRAPGLAFAAETSGRVLIYRGAPLSLDFESLVGGGARGLAAIDLEQDGDEDLLVSSTAERRLLWLRGDGAGFTRGASVALARTPLQLAAGHLAEGPAVAVVGGVEPAERTLELFGAEGGSLAMRTALPAPGLVTALFAELDPSPGEELILLHPEQAQVAYWRAGEPAPWARSAVCPGAFAARSSDLDGDGARDLLLACRSGGLDLLFGAGSPAEERVHLSEGARMEDVHAADLDGDGTLDLLAVDLPEPRLWLWRGRGGRGFAAPGFTPVSRGPIALELLPQREGLAIVVLAFEARAIDVLRQRSGGRL